MNLFRHLLRPAALVTAALLSQAGPTHGQHAGCRTLTIASDRPTTVALFYSSAVAERTMPIGPWQPLVVPGAPSAEAKLKGLMLISHGTCGTELNHHKLGTRLAREGHLVAAVRHAGDNWQERSLISSVRHFSERPQPQTQVLDALLAGSEWGPRIPAERIGAVGHSAGGYSVLALAGAQADPQRSARLGAMTAPSASTRPWPWSCAASPATSGSVSSRGRKGSRPSLCGLPCAATSRSAVRQSHR